MQKKSMSSSAERAAERIDKPGPLYESPEARRERIMNHAAIIAEENASIEQGIRDAILWIEQGYPDRARDVLNEVLNNK